MCIEIFAFYVTLPSSCHDCMFPSIVPSKLLIIHFWHVPRYVTLQKCCILDVFLDPRPWRFLALCIKLLRAPCDASRWVPRAPRIESFHPCSTRRRSFTLIPDFARAHANLRMYRKIYSTGVWAHDGDGFLHLLFFSFSFFFFSFFFSLLCHKGWVFPSRHISLQTNNFWIFISRFSSLLALLARDIL